MLDKPLFSVIVPVYNTEAYVAEAIESIVGQTIGFEKNIQLILVNDGSTDGSGAICEEYASKYLENILYIDKENGGVSSARNAGLAKARGRYINFFDSDDKWSPDAFEQFNSFLEKHPGVNIATARHEFFGAKEGKHVLSYKYEEDRVIDILEVVDCPHLSFSNAVVKRELLDGMEFDTRLNVSEDFLVFNTILLRERKLAFLSKPVYWYRKREEGGSAIDTSRQTRSWYIDTPKLCYEALFDRSEAQYGYVIPYVQYAVMYDLQWRLRNPFEYSLGDDLLFEYKDLCVSLLNRIDDEIVVMQRNMSHDQKLSILALKRGISTPECLNHLLNIRDRLYLRDENGASGGSTFLWSAKKEAGIVLQFLSFENGRAVIEGHLKSSYPMDKVDVFAECGGETRKATLFERLDLAKSTFFEKDGIRKIGFKLEVPMKNFKLKIDLLGRVFEPRITFGKFFPLSGQPYSFYFEKTNEKACYWTIEYGGKGLFKLKRRSKSWLIKREVLFERHQLRESFENKEIMSYRRDAFFWKLQEKPKERIWLIFDRTYMASDNGQALFEYIQANPIPGVKAYFAIEKDSPDYEKMKKIGPVVPFWSKEHKKLVLRADKIIASIGEDYVFNPFYAKGALLKDLMSAEFVFLQHGVTQTDLAWWLKRWNKNISLLCCVAKREKDAFLSNKKYGYDEQIQLTGFARHDKLLRASSSKPKTLLIAPTWRRSLVDGLVEGSSKHGADAGFMRSSYYKFFERLLNDEDVAYTLKENGMDAHFLLHPSFSEVRGMFSSSYCSIETEYDYTREFLEGAILLTDYSSVFFDFAILKKPILYAQFDQKEYFEKHMQKGYFDFYEDGFGPVCTTYESMKNELLSMIQEPVMGEEFSRRVDAFFGPLQPDSCARTIEAIEALGSSV